LADALDSWVEQIAAAIERYLAINPSAADSAVGISQWWLPRVGLEAAPEDAEKALMLLHARGVLESVPVGGQRFWRLAGGEATRCRRTDPGQDH
jgi:hypothetical protein